MPQFLNTVLARDTTDCTGANTGGLQVAGGAYVAKRFRVDGQALFNDNTASTSTTTGAVTIPNGGLGVGGAVYAVSFNGSGSGLTAIPPAALLAGGSDGQLLAKNGTSWSWTSPLSNPMTTLGDIIIGGAAGAPARLAKGTDGQLLAMVSGGPAWTASLPTLTIDPGGTNANGDLLFTGRLGGSANSGHLGVNWNGGFYVVPNPNDLSFNLQHPTATPTIGHTLDYDAEIYDSTGRVAFSRIRTVTTNVSGAGSSAGDMAFFTLRAGVLTEGMRLRGNGNLETYASIIGAAGTTARPTLRVPDGEAPSVPTLGDVWAASGHLYYYDGSATKDLTTDGFTNPMTAAGDIIIGGVSGSPTRLAKGTDGQVLGMVSGDPAWTNSVGGILFGGSTQEGAVNLDAADGFRVRAKVGATNDLALVNPANTVRYMNVPTGTSIPVFPQGVIAPASIVGFTAKGTGTPASLSYLLFQGFDTQNNYLQNNIQNLSSGGAASSDWIATRDNGTDASGYIDMGINSSGFSGPGVINEAGAGYLYVADGNLSIGTDTPGRDLRLFAGGTDVPESIGLTISGDESGVTALTFGGPAFFQAATTTAPSLNVPAGTAPATPASGDVWNVGGKAKWHDGTRVIALTDATSSLTGNGATSVDPVGITAAKINLTGDATLNMAAGGYDTQRLTLEVTQDASGNHTVILGTGFVWGADVTSYSVTATPNKTDYIGLIYSSSAAAWRVIAIAKGY